MQLSDAARAAGLTDGEIVEIIALVALNVFTNVLGKATRYLLLVLGLKGLHPLLHTCTQLPILVVCKRLAVRPDEHHNGIRYVQNQRLKPAADAGESRF